MSSGKPTLTLVPPIPDPSPVPDPAQAAHLSRMTLTVEGLYNTYHHSLLNYLIGLLPGGRQDAFEILHETYLRLLRMEDLQRLQENPRAYIFTIATNLVRDFIRRRTSRMQDAHIDFDEVELHSQDSTPTEVLDWEKSLDRLKRSLMDLPVTTRQIFLLSRFDELTYPQIAAALNISTRTVERHMSAALKALHLSFEDFL
jgi:RNA polymerase sigma factor (sigma-70 family)